jgi:hypothetical protein
VRRNTPTRRAMDAHTDLNIFDMIFNITETHLRGDRHTQAAATKIRAICRQQCARLLRVMDLAEAEVERPRPAKENEGHG